MHTVRQGRLPKMYSSKSQGRRRRNAENVLRERTRVDVVEANDNVVLEALMIDVAVTSDVREANTENVLLKPHRTTVAIEDIVVLL